MIHSFTTNNSHKIKSNIMNKNINFNPERERIDEREDLLS